MLRNIKNNIDIYLAIFLVVMGIAILIFPWVEKSEIKGALAGALISGAALLLGNWINRYNDRYLVEEETEKNRVKLKALIVPNLVNVFYNLMYIKNQLDNFSEYSVGYNEKLEDSEFYDFISKISVTILSLEYLGAELLLLEKHDINSLAMLRIGLEETRILVGNISLYRGQHAFDNPFLSEKIKANMGLLCTAFEQITPTLELNLKYDSEKITAIELLKQAINPPLTPTSP